MARRGGERRGRHRNHAVEDLEEVTKVSEGFHGRKSKFVEEIVEIERYRSKLATLGILIEFEVVDRSGKRVIPISFPPYDGDERDMVRVGGTANRKQIILSGGEQGVDLTAFADELPENELEKDYICLGEAHSISYWSDKHHLEGPKYQKDGAEYIHTFGEEEGGERPYLVYDRLNSKLLLVGGSYEIKDEGIYN